MVCLAKDGNGNYYLDPNFDGNRLPVSLYSVSLDRFPSDRHRAKNGSDRSYPPSDRAVCGDEVNGSPVDRLIDKAFNAQGDFKRRF